MKRIVFVASESTPFIKTGGLADVVGSLPKYIDKDKYDVRVIIPKYLCIPEKKLENIKFVTSFYVDLSWRRQYAGIFETKVDNVTFYLVDNEYYFAGPRPYGQIYEDIEKFAFFSKAALTALEKINFRPDIVHCHDWQTGVIPVLLKETFRSNPFYQGIKSVMTIHNLKFQGRWELQKIKDVLGLPNYCFTSDKLEFYGDGDFLKGGIVYADAITTVSENYAEEIKTFEYGEGLHGLLKARSNALRGIVNGIDYQEFNPETDKLIYRNYNARNFRKEKIKNKRAMQEELGLQVDDKVFTIGIVSRLTDQKGIDLIDRVMDDICMDNIQLAVLGTGEERYENMFRHFQWKYPGKVAANIDYSDEISHKIYAGCDAFLMPSLFEPCGLSQLISFRYGTIPIVRETGGLKDTVEAYNQYESTGNGFSFRNYNAHEMLNVIRYARSVFMENKREWNKLIDRAMAADFSWKVSAAKYEEMYDWMTGNY